MSESQKKISVQVNGMTAVVMRTLDDVCSVVGVTGRHDLGRYAVVEADIGCPEDFLFFLWHQTQWDEIDSVSDMTESLNRYADHVEALLSAGVIGAEDVLKRGIRPLSVPAGRTRMSVEPPDDMDALFRAIGRTHGGKVARGHRERFYGWKEIGKNYTQEEL